MGKAAVKMLCHKGPVRAIAVDRSGKYMATSGADGKVKIWDSRKFKPMYSYFSHKPTTSISISTTNIMACGFGQHVELWKNPFVKKQYKCYMKHMIKKTTIQTAQFCPFEDVLGL